MIVFLLMFISVALVGVIVMLDKIVDILKGYLDKTTCGG